jgi:hypothetical protein
MMTPWSRRVRQDSILSCCARPSIRHLVVRWLAGGANIPVWLQHEGGSCIAQFFYLFEYDGAVAFLLEQKCENGACDSAADDEDCLGHSVDFQVSRKKIGKFSDARARSREKNMYFSM